MTTPDTPDTGHGTETDEQTPRAGAPTSPGAAHSAPRPAAPLGLGERPVPPAPPSPAPSSYSSPSTTESPTTGATGPATPEAPAESAEPAGPSRVSAFGSKEPGEGAPTSPMRTVTGESATVVPAPTTPLPVERGSTTTTRVVPPGATVPLATTDSLAGSTSGSLRSGRTADEHATVVVEREAPQEEGWVPVKTRRTSAHIWGVIITLLVTPVAWFLLTDGALRTWYSLDTAEASANPAGLLSLAGGIVTLLVIALVARASSLGAWIWGGVVAAAGAAALALPGQVVDLLDQAEPTLTSIHQGFGRNLYEYLLDTSRSGLLLVFGVVVLLLALVSHASRRSGRTEGRIKAERSAAGL
ncbi:hypothetical protein [Salana multivorans]